MPLIAIAFDGEASLHALDNLVDTVAVIGGIADAHLSAHMETLEAA